MPQPTPDLSVEELLELNSLVNGDLAAAQLEIVKRLRNRLPAYIEAVNAANGWMAPPEMIVVPKPQDINVAPIDLTQTTKNCVLVATSIETSAQGIGAMKNIGRVKIWSLEGSRASTSEQVLNHMRRAECIRTVLFQFLRGCINADGVEVWRLLEPTGYAILSERVQFAGVAATFTLVQSPNMGL